MAADTLDETLIKAAVDKIEREADTLAAKLTEQAGDGDRRLTLTALAVCTGMSVEQQLACFEQMKVAELRYALDCLRLGVLRVAVAHDRKRAHDRKHAQSAAAAAQAKETPAADG